MKENKKYFGIFYFKRWDSQNLLNIRQKCVEATPILQ
jgi:hypothetical protein